MLPPCHVVTLAHVGESEADGEGREVGHPALRVRLRLRGQAGLHGEGAESPHCPQEAWPVWHTAVPIYTISLQS